MLSARADTAVPTTYPIKIFREDEDYAYLRGRDDLPFPLDLKYVPLDSGDAYVSFGGEFRVKTETYDKPNFGLGGARDFTALSERVLLHADVHFDDNVRTFIQFGFSNENGRLPVERPFDKGGLDLAQGFADLTFAVDTSHWRVRLGRQEVSIGRYITIREGTAIRRSFDGGRIDGTMGGFTLTALAARPTLNRRASFDDEPDPGDAVGVFVIGHALPGFESLHADLIGLARDFKHARYVQGVGRERRESIGVHIVGAIGRWDMNLQASHQFGTFTPLGQPHLRIDSNGAAFENGLTFSEWPFAPRFAFRLDAAEGNSNPHGHVLETFDLPYPDLTYLTDAAIIAPRNVWDIDPFVTFHPLKVVLTTIGTQFLWRLTPGDAVYTPLGIPLVPPGHSGAFVAAQPYLRLNWDPQPFLDLQVSVVRAQMGDAVRSAGGRDQTYYASALSARF